MTFTLRCTKKLLTRIDVKPEEEPPVSTTTLGDWFANILNIKHERLILFTNARTLLPVVVSAAGIKKNIETKLAEGLRELLAAIKVPLNVIDEELARMNAVAIAKTNSARVLGTMNDFQWLASAGREGHETDSLLTISVELSEAPCSPIGMQSPRDAAFFALTGRKAPPWRVGRGAKARAEGDHE